MDNHWFNFSHLKYFIELIQKKLTGGIYGDDGPISCFLEVDLDYPLITEKLKEI